MGRSFPNNQDLDIPHQSTDVQKAATVLVPGIPAPASAPVPEPDTHPLLAISEAPGDGGEVPEAGERGRGV